MVLSSSSSGRLVDEVEVHGGLLLGLTAGQKKYARHGGRHAPPQRLERQLRGQGGRRLRYTNIYQYQVYIYISWVGSLLLLYYCHPSSAHSMGNAVGAYIYIIVGLVNYYHCCTTVTLRVHILWATPWLPTVIYIYIYRSKYHTVALMVIPWIPYQIGTSRLMDVVVIKTNIIVACIIFYDRRGRACDVLIV